MFEMLVTLNLFDCELIEISIKIVDSLIRRSFLVVSSCMNTMRLIELLSGIECSLRELNSFDLISVKLSYAYASSAYQMCWTQFKNSVLMSDCCQTHFGEVALRFSNAEHLRLALVALGFYCVGHHCVDRVCPCFGVLLLFLFLYIYFKVVIEMIKSIIDNMMNIEFYEILIT